MKNVIDGVEITPEIIEMIKEWAPSSAVDISRSEMFVQSLGKVQDFITRSMQDYMGSPKEMNDINECLLSIILMKDDLNTMSKIWKS
jgi:hypothetical protein